jgi:S1-C subfamily serine protease
MSHYAVYVLGVILLVGGIALGVTSLIGRARTGASGETPATTAAQPTAPLAADATAAPQPPTPAPAPTTSTALPPATSSSSTPPVSETLNRALLATVQVIVPVDGQRASSGGSGSVLTEKGHILTNFHVVGDPDTGRLYNRRGLIFIAVSPPDLKGPPQIAYVGELMQSNRGMDLALIKIIGTQEGGVLPASLGLTTMPVGDSDTVTIGDELSIIGFPGLGGDTVTFTKGSVAGFLTDEGWIKTDAEINAGNSGGAAINRAGELVGVPSAAAAETVELPGKLGLVRPVNLARSLIDLALSDAAKE